MVTFTPLTTDELRIAGTPNPGARCGSHDCRVQCPRLRFWSETPSTRPMNAARPLFTRRTRRVFKRSVGTSLVTRRSLHRPSLITKCTCEFQPVTTAGGKKRSTRSGQSSWSSRIAAKRRQMIAWGASPRMTVNRHVEPRSCGRCHGGIGSVQHLPSLRDSQVVNTTQSWGLRPRLSSGAASRLSCGNQLFLVGVARGGAATSRVRAFESVRS